MSQPADKSIRLRISSTPRHLPVVRAAVEKLCELAGFDSQAATSVVLSLDEALTNVIRHAYLGAEDQPIDIELTPLDGPEPAAQASAGPALCRGIRVVVRDYGRPVDPARLQPRDLRDVRPGGLGVHIIRQCMDTVEYRPVEGGGTCLTMQKHLPAGDKDG